MARKRSVKGSFIGIEAKEKGKVTVTYPGTYFGCVDVPDATDAAGALAAQKSILSKSEQLPGELLIYDKVIELRNPTDPDGAPYHCSMVADVTFHKLFTDLDVFLYILQDSRTGTTKAFLIGVELGPGQAPMSAAIDAAQEKSAPKESGTIGIVQKKKKDQGSVRIAAAIETFEAELIGDVALSKKGTGQAMAETCVTLTSAETSSAGVLLQVKGIDAIRIFGALTNESIAGFPMDNITFVTVGGKKKTNLCIAETNELLESNTCFVFKCTNSARATQIFKWIKQAAKLVDSPGGGAGRGDQVKKDKKASKKEKAKDKKSKPAFDVDPFLGEGERIKSPGNLYMRQIHRADLVAQKVIGAGQFGQVYLADHITKDSKNKVTKKPRAVKTLKDVKSDADRDEFIHEAEVMLETSHRNCMGMIGVAVQQKPWLMVLEFMKYGDLRDILSKCEPKGIKLTLAEQLNFSQECCKGMEYMESIGFVHCDLAGRNVLVGEDNNCKIADFGLTRRLRTREKWTGPLMMKIPIRWSAVEVLEERRFSLKSDVWAFGIVMWEIFTYGATPYPNLRNAEVHRTLLAGGRIGQPSGCPKNVFSLMKTTWKPAPNDRPKFSSLATEIALMMRTSAGAPNIRDIGKLIKETKEDGKKKGKKGKGKTVIQGQDTYYYSKPQGGRKL